MVVRLPLSNFSPPPHPPLFFSVPVLSVKCYDNITHSIQAVRDKSKVFFCVEHRGKVEVSQQHNLPFGSIRRNRFPFLLYSQHRNSGDLKCYALCTFITTNFIVKQYQHVWVSVYTRDYHSDL